MGPRGIVRNMLLESKGLYLCEALSRRDFDSFVGLLKDLYYAVSVNNEVDVNEGRERAFVMRRLYGVAYLSTAAAPNDMPMVMDQGSYEDYYPVLRDAKYSLWVLARARHSYKVLLRAIQTGDYTEFMAVNRDNFGVFGLDPMNSNEFKCRRILDGVSGVNINDYKSFAELAVGVSLASKRMGMYLPLEDGYEDAAGVLLGLGNVERDSLLFVDSEDLDSAIDSSDVISQIGNADRDFVLGYIEWLVEPKYFAVVVCSYEGAKGHGEGTDWCTRFGEEGRHTEAYLGVGPLFVVYAHKDFETPPAVHRGIEVGGFRRICQISFAADGSLRDVKDCANKVIDGAKLSDMELSVFIRILDENSKVLRGSYVPPVKSGERTIEVFGRDVTFSGAGIVNNNDIQYIKFSNDDVAPNVLSIPDSIMPLMPLLIEPDFWGYNSLFGELGGLNLEQDSTEKSVQFEENPFVTSDMYMFINPLEYLASWLFFRAILRYYSLDEAYANDHIVAVIGNYCVPLSSRSDLFNIFTGYSSDRWNVVNGWNRSGDGMELLGIGLLSLNSDVADVYGLEYVSSLHRLDIMGLSEDVMGGDTVGVNYLLYLNKKIGAWRYVDRDKDRYSAGDIEMSERYSEILGDYRSSFGSGV